MERRALHVGSARPEHDLGEIFRKHRTEYERTHSAPPEQRKVLHDVCVCRTPFLGGHLYECGERCGFEQPAYNSCRNRHCPKCQGIAMRSWMEQRMDELLPVPYYHNIFTLPHCFNVLVPYNERLMYDLVFESASWAIDTMAQKQLDGKVGTVAVLHTWGQRLSRHVHVHCLITGGALSADRQHWNTASGNRLFDVYQLSRLFRDRLCQRLRWLYRKGKVRLCHREALHLKDPECFNAFMAGQEAIDWVVYSKRPFAGPAKVLEYLGRYTHRVAISNRRILSVSDTDIVFDYKDYRDLDASGEPRHKTRRVPIETFMALFLQHTLPKGYRKIRYYGFLAGPQRAACLAACRRLLGREALGATAPVPESRAADDASRTDLCPLCGAPLVATRKLAPVRVRGPSVTFGPEGYQDAA